MSGFDRVRPRTPDAPRREPGRPAPRAKDGRQILFSTGDADAGFGTVRIACSRCGETTPVSPLKAVRLGIPGLHLPVLRKDHPTYLRCPACKQRSWVRLALWR